MNKTEITLLGNTSRRQALRNLGLGALGIAALGTGSAKAQIAISSGETTSPYPVLGISANDLKILNFALNLEYLEANYYSYATAGVGIDGQGVDISGTGTQGAVLLPDGAVSGTPLVTFSDSNTQQYAMEIAKDEIEHVKFLRGIILAAGHKPVAQPEIDLVGSFTTAGNAAGLGGFSPFGNSSGDLNFLLGAFLFEDVGVTAYHGALAAIGNITTRGAAAGIMGTESYHASILRSQLYDLGSSAQAAVQSIVTAVNSLDGTSDEQPLTNGNGGSNIVPADTNAIVFSRTTRQVLDIVYLATNASSGGFFPNGINS